LNCKFCGKEIWLAGLFGDRDFCIPSHRKKFNERLRNFMVQSKAAEMKALRLSGPRFLASPADSPATAGAAGQLQFPSVQRPTSFGSLYAGAIRIAAPNWEFEIETEATPVTPVVEAATCAALEPARLSQDEIPAKSPEIAHDVRLQRVLDMIANMRNTFGSRKGRGLHAAA